MINNKNLTVQNNQIIIQIAKEWAHMRWGNLKTEQNIDLLIALLRKYQNDNIKEYTLQFNEVVGQLKLAGDGTTRVDTKQLDKNLTKAMLNISASTAVFEDEDNIDVKTIFSQFKFNKKQRTLYIKWNTDNLDLVESLSTNALYLHRDFYMLNSKYSKILYIALSEWNNPKTKAFKEKGYCEHTISKEELLHLMGLEDKKSYRNPKNGTSNIMDRIIKPALQDLQNSFMNINVTVDYNKTSKGRELSGYIFRWYPKQYVIDRKISNAIQMKSEGIQPKTKPKNGKSGSFEGRQYDFDQLEAQLVNNEQVPGQMSLEKDFPEWCPDTTDKDN